MSQSKIQAYITGTGSFLPENILTNQDLEKMVDTSDEWIVTRTGISERRIAPDDMGTTHMGSEAARAAMADAGIGPEEIDLIIAATFTGDMPMPACACLLQNELGAVNAAAYDLAAACSGFVYALATAKDGILSGRYKNVLVVAVEKLSTVTDWTDRNTCVLFGDGAGAAVVSCAPKGPRIAFEDLGADGSSAELLYIPAGGALLPASMGTVEEGDHYIKMGGREVFKHAVNSMVGSIDKLLELSGLTVDDLTVVVPHQANIRIISTLARTIGIDDEKVFVNLEKYGNMSSATIAVALDEVFRSRTFCAGDKVALVAFGGGFTWGSCLLEC